MNGLNPRMGGVISLDDPIQNVSWRLVRSRRSMICDCNFDTMLPGSRRCCRKVDVEFCSPASWTQPVRKHIHKPSRFKSPETAEPEGLVLDFQEQPTMTSATVSSF